MGRPSPEYSARQAIQFASQGNPGIDNGDYQQSLWPPPRAALRSPALPYPLGSFPCLLHSNAALRASGRENEAMTGLRSPSIMSVVASRVNSTTTSQTAHGPVSDVLGSSILQTSPA